MPARNEVHPLMRGWRRAKEWTLPFVAVALVAGGVARFTGQEELAAQLWATGTAAIFAVLSIDIGIGLHRREFGLDLIAALAMGGAIFFGEYLAGIVVALMFTGGQFLENFAQGRAGREMTALLSRMPNSAVRYESGGLHEVALSVIVPGDLILVRRGEIVPVDGIVGGPDAVLDQSALTGEALPVRRNSGQAVMSGSTNAGDAFDLQATSAAADSTYAGVVRLVEAAQQTKAPMVRLAARFGLGFLALTLTIAGLAWGYTGEATRALAVIVVATPCPLILAVPVAIVSGISRCAKKGILVKDGGALEALAAAKVVLLDKTGTVTDGRARLIEMKIRDGLDPLEVLRLAASLDQSSPHVVAQALVAAARERGLRLDVPADVREAPGSGLTGHVARCTCWSEDGPLRVPGLKARISIVRSKPGYGGRERSLSLWRSTQACRSHPSGGSDSPRSGFRPAASAGSRGCTNRARHRRSRRSCCRRWRICRSGRSHQPNEARG